VSSFVFYSSLLTVKSVNSVVARNGYLSVMEIVHIFHSGYLGAFQTVRDLYRLYCCITSWNITDREGQWILQFQTITDVQHYRIFIVGTLITDVFFNQFLICIAV